MTKTNSAIDAAAQEAEALSAEAINPLINHLLAGVHEAVEHLADVANKAVDKVELSSEYVKATHTKAVGGARSYVRAQPLTAVGLSVAAGFLLSWALRQR